MESSYSPAPAWPTLPSSSLGSANQSRDQAQLRKTTGFMAYHNCQIQNSTSAEITGEPASAASAQGRDAQECVKHRAPERQNTAMFFFFFFFTFFVSLLHVF